MRTLLPRLGEPAPTSKPWARAGTILLADYQGRWPILFSHPADLTPVCATKIVAFAELCPMLRERNTELVGLSIGSVYCTPRGCATSADKLKVQGPFPVHC